MNRSRSQLSIVVTIVVVAISLYISGFFSKEPAPPKEPALLCQWGSWLPCTSPKGTQTRYEKHASDEKNTFDCGEVRKMEQRACDLICSESIMPVCACTGYDMDNVCQTTDQIFHPCKAGPDTDYVPGLCKDFTIKKWVEEFISSD